MKSSQLASIVAATVLVAGCAQVPSTDIESARRMLDDAKQAQASDYAPDEWNAASDAEARLEAELKAQEERWTLTRSYAKSRALAAEVLATARTARESAVAGRERTKTEVAALMTEANAANAQAKEALAGAPKGKGTQADLAALTTDSQSIDSTLTDMQRAFDAGDYNNARAKAQAAIDAARQIVRQVEDAKSRGRAA